MTVAAVVLAAGGATRYPGPVHKLLVPFRGRPLVTWPVAAAHEAGVFDEVVVVTGAVDLGDVVGADVTILHNPRWKSGQASSLQVAVEAAGAAGHDAVVVGLGDSPLVAAAAWRSVAEAPGELVTATYAGRRRPPVKLARSQWGDLPTAGDEGARALFRRWPDRVREVACEGDPIDIDQPEDLAPWN